MNPLLNQIQEMGMQISALTVQNAKLSVMMCWMNIGAFSLIFGFAFFEWATSQEKPKEEKPKPDPLLPVTSLLNATVVKQNNFSKEIETLRSSMMGHKVLLEKAIQEQNAAAFSYVNGLGDGINERILDVQKRIIKSEELHTAHSHRYQEMGKRFDKIEQLVEFDGKRITNDYMEVTGEIGKVSRNLRVLDRRTEHLKKKKTPSLTQEQKVKIQELGNEVKAFNTGGEK